MENPVKGMREKPGLALPRFDDHEAFTQFYWQTAPGIYAYLHRLCGCPHVAEDLLQETFLAVYKGLADFKGHSSPRTWLYTIATNKFRDHCRNRWGKAELGSEWIEALPSPAPLPLDEVIQREESRRIQEAVLALPLELRTALLLVRFEELKYREAAQILGTTLGTVRMRVHRAHCLLAQALG
jgi:RNA polymerase sigma-70 factor (ECF subfamily)